MFPDSRTWTPSPTRITSLPLNAGLVIVGTPAQVAFQLPSLTEILAITASYPCWVTLYTSLAALLADASRTIYQDPIAGQGAIVDIYCVSANVPVITSPVPLFNNPTSIPNAPAFLAIRNMGGSNSPISLTVTHCPEQI